MKKMLTVAAVIAAASMAVAITSMLGLTFADDEHVVTQADTLQWKAAPPSLPAGAQIAILSGDPSKAEPYVVRFWFPATRSRPIPIPTMKTSRSFPALSIPGWAANSTRRRAT